MGEPLPLLSESEIIGMSDYGTQLEKEYTKKIRALLTELPSCCATFLRGIESQTSVRTRYGYAIDLRTFFQFLIEQVQGFQDVPVREITLLQLEALRAVDIEIFLEHLSLYTKSKQDEQAREIVNQDKAKARKLSTLRSFFKYFYKREMISGNVAALVEIPKLHNKAIIRLEPNEIADLLDAVDEGTSLSSAQKKYHRFTKARDVAILTLFLGTGIRISELVGIDLEHVDFMNNSFVVLRKGGSQEMLAFGDEVRSALLTYLAQRETMQARPGHEKALFLSIQNKRIGVRAVENMVKKYASIATPLKKISPHKLRSTFGTMLYQETGDIYLVADVLGHKDVNTTRKHYAAASQDRRRIAARVIKLREDAETVTPPLPSPSGEAAQTKAPQTKPAQE